MIWMALVAGIFIGFVLTVAIGALIQASYLDKKVDGYWVGDELVRSSDGKILRRVEFSYSKKWGYYIEVDYVNFYGGFISKEKAKMSAEVCANIKTSPVDGGR